MSLGPCDGHPKAVPVTGPTEEAGITVSACTSLASVDRRSSVSDRRAVHLWCELAICRRVVRPYSVVTRPTYLDQDLGFGKAVEDFAVKQLIAQAAVERFTIAILPRATKRELKRLHPDLPRPVLPGGADELGALI